MSTINMEMLGRGVPPLHLGSDQLWGGILVSVCLWVQSGGMLGKL